LPSTSSKRSQFLPSHPFACFCRQSKPGTPLQNRRSRIASQKQNKKKTKQKKTKEKEKKAEGNRILNNRFFQISVNQQVDVVGSEGHFSYSLLLVTPKTTSLVKQGSVGSKKTLFETKETKSAKRSSSIGTV
jgi:hypothetical protein